MVFYFKRFIFEFSRLGLSFYYVEDGIDDDINGYGGWFFLVSYGSYVFFVVG